MPFLRAALIKKKAGPEPEEQEEKIILPPAVEVSWPVAESVDEIEANILPDIEAIDELEIDELPDIEPDAESEEKADESPIVEPVDELDVDALPEVEDIAEIEQEDLPEVEEPAAEVEAEREILSDTEPVSDIEQENLPVDELDVDTLPEVKQEDLPDVEPVNEPQPEIEPETLPEVEEIAELEPETVSEAEDIAEAEPDNEPETPSETQAQDDERAKAFAHLPSEILEAVAETPQQEQEPEPEPVKPKKDYTDFTPEYDFTSGTRYVDAVSTKTEFDKMLDELAAISKDLLNHEVEKFAMKFTGKFQGDFDKAESDAKKYEAFLGGYITNAAMALYDNGYSEAAVKQLKQAESILEARKKLEQETEATRTRVEENNDAVDLTDILGLFGD